MRILVCGGRDLQAAPWVFRELASQIFPWDEVITGGAKGADSIANEFAKGLGCRTRVFFADWEKHGKSAGPKRNQQMMDEGKPDKVLAFPGGRGTADMVRRATEAGVPVILLEEGV